MKSESKEYSTWVVGYSVFYLYGIDWVYDIELVSPMELEVRFRLLHNN